MINSVLKYHPQTRFLFFAKWMLALTDIFLINLAFLTARLTYIHFIHLNQPGTNSILSADFIILVLNLTWLLAANYFQLYKEHTIIKLEHVYRSTVKATAVHILVYPCLLFIAAHNEVNAMTLLLFYSIWLLFMLISRFIATYMQEKLPKTLNGRRSVGVIGSTQTAHKLAHYFESNQHVYRLERFIGENDQIYMEGGILEKESFGKHLTRLASAGVKEIFISTDSNLNISPQELIEQADLYCIRLNFVPNLPHHLTEAGDLRFLGVTPIIRFRKEPMSEITNRFKKRAFDLFISLTAIIFILSWLYPLLAIIIKIQSPGPVLFKQLRSGRDNQDFYCFKFRSMRINTDSDKKQAVKGDARITRIGNFMRKTSLDELPQFFNVLMGQMSAIGPRPHMLAHTEHYSQIVKQYMARHYVKPGVTGWAQVNGFRGETNEPSLMESRVEHDIWYMENWSLMLDVKIVFLTIINMLKGEQNAF